MDGNKSSPADIAREIGKIGRLAEMVARQLFMESLEILRKHSGLGIPEWTKRVGRTRQWYYGLAKSKKAGTTLATIDVICNVASKDTGVTIHPSDLFQPELIRTKLSSASVNSSVTAGRHILRASEPEQQTIGGPTDAEKYVALEARVQELEARLTAAESELHDVQPAWNKLRSALREVSSDVDAPRTKPSKRRGRH